MPASPRSSAPACCRTPISRRCRFPTCFGGCWPRARSTPPSCRCGFASARRAASRARAGSASRCSAPWRGRSGLVAVLCLLGAPVVVHLVAPGFASNGERFPLAVTFVRLSVPYVALSGVVAVAASALNAQGRVAAAAFGLVVFNGVLRRGRRHAAAPRARRRRRSPQRCLSASMVAAGAAQLMCVGAAWMRTEERPRRLAFTSSPAVRRFLSRRSPASSPAASRSSS